MWIVKPSTLRSFWRRHPQAEAGLRMWHKLAKGARWDSIQDVRAAFPHADPVMVGSGRIVVVFNVCGNRYRLITAIHYNRRMVFVLMFMTHAEYSKESWKDML